MRRFLIDENISPKYRTQLLYHESSLTVLVIGDEGAPAKGTSDPEILVWCEQDQFSLITNNRESMPQHLSDHKELPTPFGIATTEVIPIREIEGVSDISYPFYYLLLPNVRISLAGKMQGTTGRQRLSKDALVNLQIPLPPLPEQRAIAAVFQAIDQKIAALEREVEHLDELFHAMLDELMTGQRSAVPLIDTEVDV